MKAAIIEDEQSHIALLSKYLRMWSNDRQMKMEIVPYTSAESFLFCWEEEKDFDVLFVDIQMQAMNGIEMAKKIRQKDSRIKIVFTTGISDYWEEGYEVEALHYLLKPISEEKIRECMDKVLDQGKGERFILVNTKDGVEKFRLEDINYIEARGHCCIMEIIDGEIGRKQAKILEIIESISELERMLEPSEFVRCHRSYICSIGNIHHMDKTEKSIIFDIGSRIPVSRRLYREVNQAFIEHFRRM